MLTAAVDIALPTGAPPPKPTEEHRGTERPERFVSKWERRCKEAEELLSDVANLLGAPEDLPFDNLPTFIRNKSFVPTK